MSKTFKSLAIPKREAFIKTSAGSANITISDPSFGAYGMTFKPEDIPSLMLALGEAAGVVPKVTAPYLNGTPEHLANIQWELVKYAKAQAAIAAQAEETAKLEALAQELVNAYPTIVWEELTTMGKTRWIQVAAKALELGASVGN